VLGRYTVRETVAPPGFAASPDTKTAELTTQNRDAVISIAFVNDRPIVKLTEFGYVNTPKGTPTRGITSGVTTYTIKLKNFGGAQAFLNGSITVSISGAGNGTFSCISGCTSGSTLTWGNITLAPGAERAFNITVEYSNAADGARIDANLTSTYTLNGLTRETSGSPALIRFTLQSD
jgi:archaellum component FlaG (FlaF/FlaG flagellin family)